MIALLLTLPALAALSDDPLVAALIEQLERNQEQLHIDDAPPLYHLRYHLLLMDSVEVGASQGGLLYASHSPFNGLGVEVRVGAPELDSTGFGGWEDGMGFVSLPVEPTPLTVRNEAWRLTDRAYKEAVEQYARKAATWEPPPDHPGDFQLLAPTTAQLGTAHGGDFEALKQLAVDLSAAFPRDPALEVGQVFMGHEAGSQVIVDTEGTRVQRPRSETSIRAVAHVRTASGLLLTDQLLWSVLDPSDLPPASEMEGAIAAMATGLLAIACQPELTEEYVGPVIFEDDAAIQLFREMLVPQLEGTPPVVPFDTWIGELGGDLGEGAGGAEARLGRRVLPPGWSVVDDPRMDPHHPATFEVDAEGTPTQAVDLVEDGIVRQVLMSRVPRKGTSGTNGHARGQLGRRLPGRASELEVRPDAHTGHRKLRKQAAQLARAYGRDYVYLVRRLQDPAVFGVGGGNGVVNLEDVALPPPVYLVRVYADGREEIVHGGSFSGVHRWVLRDIVAAGEEVSGTYLAPSTPGGTSWDPLRGIPTLLRAPEVLVGELEIVPTPADPKDIRVVPAPQASP